MFNRANFIGHSGQELAWKVECDSLDVNDHHWIVDRIMEKFPSFCYAYGVPSGGNKVENLLFGRTTKSSMFHLIYDDVLTTGGSMEEAKKYVMRGQLCPEEFVIGIVLFARTKPESWICPIWQLW